MQTCLSVSLLGWPACCCFSSRLQCFKNRPLTGGPAWACLLILSVCLKWGVVSIQKPFYPQIWTICFSINLTCKSICIPFYSFFVSHLGSGLDRGRNEFFLGLPAQSFQILILNLFEYPYTEWPQGSLVTIGEKLSVVEEREGEIPVVQMLRAMIQ